MESAAGVKMHPAVKILVTLFTLLAVSLGSSMHFYLVLFVLLLLYVRLAFLKHLSVFSSARTMLFRMRWFFFSILLIYGWVDSGGGIETRPGNWVDYLTPDPILLQAGLYQIAVISLFVMTINFLLTTTSKEELVEGLYYLLTPLRQVGCPVERFVLRVILVLEALEQVFLSLTFIKKNAYTGDWFQRVSQVGVMAYQSMLDQASEQETGYRTLIIRRPDMVNWLFPLIVAVIFLII